MTYRMPQGYPSGPMGQQQTGKRANQRGTPQQQQQQQQPQQIYDPNQAMNYYIQPLQQQQQQQQQQIRGQPAYQPANYISPYQYQIFNNKPMQMFPQDVNMLMSTDQIYQQQQLRQQETQQANAQNQYNIRSPKTPPNMPNMPQADAKKKIKKEFADAPPQIQMQPQAIMQQQLAQQQQQLAQQQQQTQSNEILPTKDSFQPNMEKPPGLFNIMARGNIPGITFVCDVDSCYGFE